MRTRTPFGALATTLLVLCTVQTLWADAFVPVYRHVGSTNPTTEGWTEEQIGDTSGIVWGPITDGSVQAWQIDNPSTAGRVRYHSQPLITTGIPNAIESRAMEDGWRLSWTVRLPDNSTPLNRSVEINLTLTPPSFSARRYDVVMGTNSAGTLMIQDLLTTFGGLGSTLTLTGYNNSTYHTFDLVYSPHENATQLSIDGSVIVPYSLNWNGGPDSFGNLTWGSVASAAGEGRWAFVQFGYLPEPASATLLTLGALALLRRRGGA